MECKLVGLSFQSIYYSCCPGFAADVTSRVVHIFIMLRGASVLVLMIGVSKIAFEITLVP